MILVTIARSVDPSMVPVQLQPGSLMVLLDTTISNNGSMVRLLFGLDLNNSLKDSCCDTYVMLLVV